MKYETNQKVNMVMVKESILMQSVFLIKVEPSKIVVFVCREFFHDSYVGTRR